LNWKENNGVTGLVGSSTYDRIGKKIVGIKKKEEITTVRLVVGTKKVWPEAGTCSARSTGPGAEFLS
jgi:hypothetical protein